MTKEELMDIIEYESTIYQRWEDHSGDIEILEESISKAFSHVKEAVEEFFSKNETK